ncbi:response regulator transcription factor [Amycolatopsis sp. NPDC059027]|uniref:helix-turn-helix transcriptional regulator n=1 Tax=unclassified Amycolatopsis TaxID=2618356 RepID=UPI00366F4A7A
MGTHGQPDDRPQIQRTLAGLREATGLPLAFGGEIGAGQVRLTQFAGVTTGALKGVTLDRGRGLGGKVLVLRRPVVVNDYVRANGISHHYDHVITAEGLRAMIAAPVVVSREVRAVLYGALRSDEALGDRVVQSVLEAARELEQRLAVQDEVVHRLAWFDRYGATGQANPRWELVRQAYAELRILAQDVGDTALRRRVAAICAKLSTMGGPAGARPSGPRLSARELDVLACVSLGWTNAQAAADLGITVETVKSYLRSAMRKLLAHSRMEAVVTARRLGLLP